MPSPKIAPADIPLLLKPEISTTPPSFAQSCAWAPVLKPTNVVVPPFTVVMTALPAELLSENSRVSLFEMIASAAELAPMKYRRKLLMMSAWAAELVPRNSM